VFGRYRKLTREVLACQVSVDDVGESGKAKPFTFGDSLVKTSVHYYWSAILRFSLVRIDSHSGRAAKDVASRGICSAYIGKLLTVSGCIFQPVISTI
jgi:hypothetical protein